MRISPLRAATALAAALLITAGATACSSGDEAKPAVEISGGNNSAKKAGTVLDTPKEKPDLILNDFNGKKYDLIKETKGKPTLLFFGYTHCPDVCPVIMSDIALAKSKLPKAEQDKLQVVFVTTDPKRDTEKRLKKWLGMQDKDFIGLTGDWDTIEAGARTVGIFMDKPKKQKDGSYTVGHSSEVLAYSPKDDKAHVIYLAGVDSEQYAKDMPKLIKGQTP
ncbi:SCO family protein [Streptomyces sp. A7024]|uniref:SCO family protein n=1 Tax=Streptomyces coryli TaxID=1128680 RepID=A0A6G4U998_9ACTN|nr:SCO family protein [Streptomyces coryli]NGN68582.1 SCO family protein [Streptomyces coryli]